MAATKHTAEAQMANIAAFFSRVAGGELKKSAEQQLNALAQSAARLVRLRYRQLSTRPVGLTRTIIVRGKERGPISGRPAREPRSAGGSMTLLSKHIIIEYNSGRPVVRIDPAAVHPDKTLRYPAGTPLALIGHWYEKRSPVTMKVSFLMLTYLRMMHEKRGGFGTKKGNRTIKNNGKTYGTIKYTPPERPVWSWAAEQLMQLGPKTTGLVRERLTALGKQYGMKPL